MRTIILCGGKGTRLHEETEFKPKPLVQIGGYPILVHIMNIYAHYGYKDFILALGYKGDMIKDYFLTLSRYEDDFEFNMKTGKVKRLDNRNKYDYNITFAETGNETKTSGRVLRCQKYIDGEDFMVTFGDGVANIDIEKLLEFHNTQKQQKETYATISVVHPTSSYGRVTRSKEGLITSFQEKKPVLDDHIDGGFHVYSTKAIPFFKDDEMLFDTLTRLSKNERIAAHKHSGFWYSMDNMKDYLELNRFWKESKPWAVWEDNIK